MMRLVVTQGIVTHATGKLKVVFASAEAARGWIHVWIVSID
jgi:hypothetical protein